MNGVLPYRLSSPDGRRLTMRAYALLILLGLALFLPGLATLPPLDRDEPRYAQASKQMIESGDYGDIRFQNEPRYKKPIGIYWLQSASARLFGAPPYDAIWPYRLPSLLAGLLALCLTAWGASRLGGAAAGILSAFILASSNQLCFEGHIAKTDAALLACVIGAQFILARAYSGGIGAPLAYGFWLLQAAGILIKGPIAPFISGLTILALWAADRKAPWLRQLRPLRGFLLCAALVLPWLAWIGIASRGAFYNESAGHDFLGKILQGQDRGFLPPGYHTLLLPVLFLPQIMLISAGLRRAWRDKAEPLNRFALAWIIPLWLTHELIATKLPHYVLPAYPALAWLAARQAVAGDLPQAKAWRFGVKMQSAALCLSLTAMGLAPLFLGTPSWLALLLAATGMFCALRQARLFWNAPRHAVLYGLGAALCLFGGLSGILLPMSQNHWLSPNIARLYAESRPCPLTSRLVTQGYNEPSLVFLAGTKTYFANNATRTAMLMAMDSCIVVALRDKDEPVFRAALAVHGADAEALGTIRGFHYNGGGWQQLTLYRQRRAPFAADPPFYDFNPSLPPMLLHYRPE